MTRVHPNATRRSPVPIPAAAEFVGCHPKTIRRMISRGEITGYRFGPRMIRVDLAEVEAAFAPIPAAERAG